ncbi:MAG: hypothetical protein C0606_16330 [Hyphomicrobiales bacterium]|nr:MAG: hypothetical protein C0606_16330 [Hyphomicrobiales bacterium]
MAGEDRRDSGFSGHGQRPGAGPKAIARDNAAMLLGQLSRYVSLIAVCAMVAIISYEVFMRYVLGSPTVWVTEYSSYLMLVVVFVGAAFVQLSDRQVSADFVSAHLSADNATRLRAATIWFELVIITVIGWKYLDFVHSEYVTGSRSWGLLATKLWIPEAIVAAGYLLLVWATLAKVLKHSDRLSPASGGLAATIWLVVTLALVLLATDQFVFKPRETTVVLIVAVLGVVGAATASRMAAASILAGLLLFGAGLFAVMAKQDLLMQMLAFGATLFLLLSVGVGIAFLMAAIGVFGGLFWLPFPMVEPVAARAWETVTNSTLTAIPAFVLFGAILVRSGISRDMFHAFRVIGGRVPGSIAHASIAASGLFAAVSGSSLATAATIGQVAGPEMIRHGYSRYLTYGVIAAGGTLGILIPPSIALLLYGSIVGVPATKLFLAGIVPGLFLMALFSVVVFIWVFSRPGAAPQTGRTSLKEKVRALLPILPFVLLIVVILGSLYLGIATPTEAGSVGALAAFILTILKGKATLRLFRDSFEEAAIVTSFLLIVAVGAAQMGYVLDYVGAATALVNFVVSLELESWAVFAGITVMYIVLGMFIEPISMMLMTLPVVAPLAQGAGMDMLWFGIVLVLLIEIGLVTPPVGMILFVLKGVAPDDTSLTDIARGVAPFVLIIFVALVTFYLVPELVTALPKH